MRISKLSYKDRDWEIKDLELDKVCLLVGKNSTGKSKTLSAIDYLGKIITQKIGFYKETEWNVTFQENDGEIKYKFHTGNKLVIHSTRDVKKYPFLEDIAFWAEHSYGFKFSSINPERPVNQEEFNLLTSVGKYPRYTSH